MKEEQIQSATNLIQQYLKEHQEPNNAESGILAKMLDDMMKKRGNEFIETIVSQTGEITTEGETNTEEVELNVKQKALPKIIAAAIAICKEKGGLPEEISDKVGNPVEVAATSFDTVTIINVVTQIANGDFSSISKVIDYLIDMGKVKVIAIASSLIDSGMEYLKALAEACAYNFDPSLGNFVSYVLDYVAPTVTNVVKIGVAKVINKVSSFLKKTVKNFVTKDNKQKQESVVTA